jgi:histidine triad (HIT) family protein
MLAHRHVFAAAGAACPLDAPQAACNRSNAKRPAREQFMRNYDANNIFAKILRGELPSHKVYEDDETLAFMDIMPRCEGHTLVVPKTPARNVLDANPAQLAACMKTVQKVSLAIMKACNADGITVQQFNEQAGGQVVFHLHFHVLPRREGVTLGPHTSKMEKPEVLAANAEKIRRALAAQ